MIDMFTVLPVAIPLIGICLFLVIFTTMGKSRAKGKDKNKAVKVKDRKTIIKESNRKLAQNPKDGEALTSLAELYFKENMFDKAIKLYSILIDLCATNKELDEANISLKYAVCALKTNKMDDAYKNFAVAYGMKNNGFEVNYYLGFLEFKKGNYEKAAKHLSKARELQPEHIDTMRYYGFTLTRLLRYKEAAPLLRKTVSLEPEDKESLFLLGQCYHELSYTEKAIQIFSHLRADPKLGPEAALTSGNIYSGKRLYARAIMDFEIGLRHKNIEKSIRVELMYRLAAAYIQEQEIGKALKLFFEIQSIMPSYKDVLNQIKRYEELNLNKNLQTFLIGTSSDFINLCRKVSVLFFPKAKVKIVDISVQKAEFADILTEVHAPRWEDEVLFRFVRTTGNIGELLLRDLHSRIKEVKAGRGFCLSAGTFTEGAKTFVEGRMIDLVDKSSLVRKLNLIEQSRIMD